MKSPGSDPVNPIEVILSEVYFDPLVSVTDIGELLVPTVTLPKFNDVGFSLTTVPVPVSDTVCGLPAALSVTDIVPVSAPTDPGVKVTEMVQFAPAATLDPQVLVSPKFALATILVMLSEPVPVLVRVTV